MTSKLIKYIPTDKDNFYIKITLSYHKENYSNSPRGYYVSVCGVTRQEYGESHDLMHKGNTYRLLQSATRFSQKDFDKITELLRQEYSARLAGEILKALREYEVTPAEQTAIN